MSDLKRSYREIVRDRGAVEGGMRPGARVQDIVDELSITVGGSSKVVDRLGVV